MKARSRLLLVEADELLADVTAFRLELLGYLVETVHQGDAAIKLVRERKPDLFIIDYRDGLRGSVLTWSDGPQVVEWTAAWRYADRDETAATVFWTQEWRPFMHFSYQLQGVERMMLTQKPAWPAAAAKWCSPGR